MKQSFAWAKALAVAIAVALPATACDWIDPGAPTYAGVVMETRGACWTILGDPAAGPDGKTLRIRYAVKAGDGARLGLKAGQRVTIRGRMAAKQDCAAAVVLAPEA